MSLSVGSYYLLQALSNMLIVLTSFKNCTADDLSWFYAFCANNLAMFGFNILGTNL